MGERTLLIDDPQLTVRDQPVGTPPWRLVVVESADALPAQRRLWQAAGPVWLLSRQPSRRHWPDNVHVVTREQWSPAEILAWLTQRGIQSLLVEGGSHLQAAFVAAGVLDQLVTYLAPQVLGGTGLPAVWGAALPRTLALHRTAVTPLAADLKVTYERSRADVHGNH